LEKSEENDETPIKPTTSVEKEYFTKVKPAEKY